MNVNYNPCSGMIGTSRFHLELLTDAGLLTHGQGCVPTKWEVPNGAANDHLVTACWFLRGFRAFRTTACCVPLDAVSEASRRAPREFEAILGGVGGWGARPLKASALVRRGLRPGPRGVGGGEGGGVRGEGGGGEGR